MKFIVGLKIKPLLVMCAALHLPIKNSEAREKMNKSAGAVLAGVSRPLGLKDISFFEG